MKDEIVDDHILLLWGHFVEMLDKHLQSGEEIKNGHKYYINGIS